MRPSTPSGGVHQNGSRSVPRPGGGSCAASEGCRDLSAGSSRDIPSGAHDSIDATARPLCRVSDPDHLFAHRSLPATAPRAPSGELLRREPSAGLSQGWFGRRPLRHCRRLQRRARRSTGRARRHRRRMCRVVFRRERLDEIAEGTALDLSRTFEHSVDPSR
jgi:hypothetical protein